MEVFRTEIGGVVVARPDIFNDSRGYFYESFSAREFEEKVRPGVVFVQDNQSFSSYGVLRGLHFQKPPFAQGKLVRVVQGRVIDIAVDIRKGSPTYGKYVAEELTGENHRQMFVPRGFAHGYIVLSGTALFQYKCDSFYCPESEGTIIWNDPDLAIRWPLPAEDIRLSDKDRAGILFRDFESPFDYSVDPYV